MTVRIGYSILDALQGPAGPCEIVSESEAEAIYIIERLNLELVKSLAKDGKPTERDQHPKQHGFVTAKFTVLKDHCKDQRIGLFLEPRTYTAVIRFSNSVGHDDAVPDNHGMAIKLLGVKGEKLLPDEMDAKTQDFVLLDHPLFFTENVSTLAAFSLDREALVKESACRGRSSSRPSPRRGRRRSGCWSRGERSYRARSQRTTSARPLTNSGTRLSGTGRLPSRPTSSVRCQGKGRITSAR